LNYYSVEVCCLTLKRRAASVAAFQGDPPTTVFLISMRSGAVGLNLTAANKVFLMEPLFNPALEAQAVGRAHRMGQTRPVTVYKLVAKDTVDERILQLCASRDAASAAGRAETRRNDAVGALKADSKRLLPAELGQLFQ
jgi:SWI/SNF-related matrix-associated actin-dependent regulator of chromatin subfamily A3